MGTRLGFRQMRSSSVLCLPWRASAGWSSMRWNCRSYGTTQLYGTTTKLQSTHAHHFSGMKGKIVDVWTREVSAAAVSPEKLAQIRTLQRSVQDVTVVDSKEAAMKVLDVLNSHELRCKYHAWDTETTGINPKEETPVGNGRVICATAYCGPDVDFGEGPRLWIDNSHDDILQYFKEYFENPKTSKTWHNYGFDRHVLYNHGIDCAGFKGDTMHMARILNTSMHLYSLENLTGHYLKQPKRNMSDIFGKKNILKNGTVGKKRILPSTLELQYSLEDCRNWVKYATLDAKMTWDLRNTLQLRLMEKETRHINGNVVSLWDIYEEYLIPFGEMLTDIERIGFKVDVERLREAEVKTEQTVAELQMNFREWLKKEQPEAAKYMNLNSDKQKQALFFGNGKKTKRIAPQMTTFKRTGKGDGPKEFQIKSIGLPVEERTEKKLPSISEDTLRSLAGDMEEDAPGKAFERLGTEGCKAIQDLCDMKVFSTLKNTFVKPLQLFADKHDRVHPSLNLNTETGRLSCRRPNLQNQPAHDKDKIGIRRSFVCERGNKLIVADYGQLELRILADISNCRSMIQAFESGGDFHSRTAMSMYPHVREAVQAGEVILEWHGANGEPAPKPLLKNAFALERRRAKVLNFSIAYGKTALGLAKDWGVSLDEAKQTLEYWYNDRPEVKEWQNATRGFAFKNGYVKTLLGRRRDLPGIWSRNYRVFLHNLRAAINTPIQGSAADIVMVTMVNIWRSRELAELGWHTILQIHDEVVLEGPEETAEEAAKLVRSLLENPFKQPLKVKMSVDLNIGDSWSEAK